MVLAEPIQEKPVRAKDLQLTVFIFAWFKGKEPSVESLLWDVLPYEP
jgi:hypothetical protein